MATPNNEYIVFEPDQVLTDTDLNELFNYLDQQDRWTRNKLIGIGIACGLDLVQIQAGVIGITRGCGVTSEGYLIQLDARQYMYYTLYDALPQPNDLPFSYPGDLPFYKPFCDEIAPVYLLLSKGDYGRLDTTQQAAAQPLGQLNGLGDWLVVLFLEVREKDMANCDTNNCDNKGERMIFSVRPLLVNKKTWQRANSGGVTGKAPEIRLKRYNVPAASLANSTAVLNAFLSVCDDPTLKQVEGACNWCFQAYAPAAPAASVFAAGTLAALRDHIRATAPLQLEYFYDFINDLILAYYEIREAARGRATGCCPDELQFPLHLVLGEADHTTAGFGADGYRQYFLYSGLFGRQESSGDRLALLLRRMQIMVAGFSVPENRAIRITPSQYQTFPLSRRAIPWYYKESKGDPNSLFQWWNYERTSEGNAAFNLSYNARDYNSDPAIVTPLLYDIEPYHFFRIEGHIGQPYTTVLKNLLGQRSEFNLPFDIVAVSAELLKPNTALLPECNIRDLITDYRLLLTGFACRVHTVYCFLTKAPYQVDGAADGLNKYLATYGAYKTAAAVQETPLALPFDNANYAKGDFMRLFCPPPAATLGAAYLADLAAGKRSEMPELFRPLYTFINLVESLMFQLVPGSLSALGNADLTREWQAYNRGVYNVLQTETQAKLGSENILLFDTLALSALCLDEELLAIYKEYIRRLELYQAQLSFLQYFRKHPGLEHKAGVPKGGTFVLVYHETALRKEVGVAAASSSPLSAADYEVLRDFVSQCTNAPGDQQKKAISILSNYRPAAIEQGYSIGQGIVIADFYIPYLCCSDCAPVAYILKPDQPTTVFDLQPRTFLFDDAHNYKFTTVPPVTAANTEQRNFKTDGLDNPDNLNLWTDARNNLWLHPADPTIKATRTSKITWQDITIGITLIRPDAGFQLTLAPDGQGQQHATVKANQTDATEYHWTQNGKKVLDNQSSGTFAADSGGTISLTIAYTLNGAVSTDTKDQAIPQHQ